VILYAWTAVTAGSPEYGGSLGVSDNSERARLAAEPYLRSGLARLAYVESVHTVISAHSLSPHYVPTGAGWWATPAVAPAGVEWVRFTDPATAGGLRALAESAGCDADGDS
jgi:hypothetical protein